MSELREEHNTFELEREDAAVVGEVIRQLRDTRDQIAALKKSEAELRKQLLSDLDKYDGSLYDENSGLRATIKSNSRWEYDPQRLRDTGELSDTEFADVLVTSVDKKKVEELVLKGTARERMIQSAKVETKAYETIEIKEEMRPTMRESVRRAQREAGMEIPND